VRQGIDQVLGRIMVDADVIAWGYITLARLRQAKGAGPGALAMRETLTHLADQRILGPKRRPNLPSNPYCPSR
jgi:hypothetical protein